MDETDEILRRIRGQRGVIGIIVMDAHGIPLKTTLSSYSSVQYAGYLQPLTQIAHSTVREIDPEDALTFLRIRTQQYEIIVTPDRGNHLVVLQNPNG
ncbi:dynein light chain roadblock-type 2 [Tachyglossus aculeatus]|uniref:dynein light chain roadblock-type 2 n=1 Tax=Tachyglossus aculeatus TaxID=9261 RepID=UPI0018F78B07|nr:dynein light chain roadblock-type 2 [Tachyglossus aculeatus]